MDVAKKCELLENDRLQLQLKKRRNELYERLLIVLGTVSVLIAILMLVMSNLYAQGMGLLVIGVALVSMGSIWQHKDERQMAKVEEKLHHCREQKIAGIRDADEY